LGEDKDGDGLPDAWEEWQLYIAGRRPGVNGWDLSLITRDGDFDGDGISNFHEYIAGTFAADPSDRFELRLLGKTASAVQLEFFGITGKVYTVEGERRSQDVDRGAVRTGRPRSGAGALPGSRRSASGRFSSRPPQPRPGFTD